MRQTKQDRQLDQQVQEIVSRRLSGVPINILNIGQVFAAARTAASTGADVEQAVVSTYTQLAEPRQ